MTPDRRDTRHRPYGRRHAGPALRLDAEAERSLAHGLRRRRVDRRGRSTGIAGGAGARRGGAIRRVRNDGWCDPA